MPRDGRYTLKYAPRSRIHLSLPYSSWGEAEQTESRRIMRCFTVRGRLRAPATIPVDRVAESVNRLVGGARVSFHFRKRGTSRRVPFPEENTNMFGYQRFPRGTHEVHQACSRSMRTTDGPSAYREQNLAVFKELRRVGMRCSPSTRYVSKARTESWRK